MDEKNLDRNTIAFIGLATEFCSSLERAEEFEKEEFVASMLRMLPRLYIMMTDFKPQSSLDFEEPLGQYVEEQQYENLRARIAALLAEDDSYLETFEQDMKYSDTPIAASIAEGLADIYQDLCNFLVPVRDSEAVLASQAMQECHDNFVSFWAQTLVNVMRPLNHIQYRF